MSRNPPGSSWKPHAAGGITPVSLGRHLELIGRKPRLSRGGDDAAPAAPAPPIALVHNAWTGVKTYSTCGKSFASRDDAQRFRGRVASTHASQVVTLEVASTASCGPECLPCAYGLYGTCANTRQSSVHALRVAKQLSANATAAHLEVLPTVTVCAPAPLSHQVESTSRESAPAVSLEQDEAFAHAMDQVRRGSPWGDAGTRSYSRSAW